MKTTQKVKIQTTTATIAVIYNDNSNAIKNIQIVGKYTLSNAKKYFKKEIDLKNILSAARLRRMGQNRDEFIGGGTLKKDTLMESLTVKNFGGCFLGTEYEDIAEDMEADEFRSLAKYESDADDHLFFLTDSLCAKMSTYEPFLNYYTRARVELKAMKTALVCVKTDARDVFFSRMPKIYD